MIHLLGQTDCEFMLDAFGRALLGRNRMPSEAPAIERSPRSIGVDVTVLQSAARIIDFIHHRERNTRPVAREDDSIAAAGHQDPCCYWLRGHCSPVPYSGVVIRAR
jgi:hypothetical protein